MIEPLVLSVPDLIDMAVGSAEVNVNLLNTVLHLVVSQIAVDGVRIQLNSKVPAAHRPPQRTVPPNEFTVFNVLNASPDGQLDLKKCRLEPKLIADKRPVNTLVVLEDSYPVRQLYMKNDLIEKSLPDASELVEACRVDDGKTLSKLLDLLNITKRIEATELSIEKNSSLICELSKMMKNQPSVVSEEHSSKTSHDYEEQKRELHDLHVQVSSLTAKVHSLHELPFRLDRLASMIDNLDQADGKERVSADSIGVQAQVILDDLSARIAQVEERCQCRPRPSSSLEKDSSAEYLTKVEIYSSKSEEQSEQLDFDTESEAKRDYEDEMADKYSSAASMICTLQNEMVRLFKHLEDHGKFAKAMQCQLLDCINNLEELRQNVHGLNVDVNMLVQERRERTRQYEAIIDQLEQIKCVKADREEVEQMVIVKADIKDMRTKVPFSQFDDMRKDLSLSLIDALEKIVETDLEWHRAIDSIHDLLQLKLDKTEATQMVEDFTNRMIALKDKLRGFGMFRLSCESAATSEKYLKNVKCLACNAQTYMKPELSLPQIPRMGKFGRIPDPDVRKFARITVPCSMRQEIKEPQTVLRFCGGHHTKLEMGEKHSVKGNFIAQTGGVPSHSNANVQMAYGTDGQLYRVDVNDCNCGDS